MDGCDASSLGYIISMESSNVKGKAILAFLLVSKKECSSKRKTKAQCDKQTSLQP
jgi:hypothetical protein